MCLPDCEVTGKRSYRSRGDALRQVQRHLRGRSGWTPAFRPYRCPHCHCWHLTRKRIASTLDPITRTLRRRSRLQHRRLHD